MKQFFVILKFELKEFFTNKVFIGITALLIVIGALANYIPSWLSGSLYEDEEIVDYDEDYEDEEDAYIYTDNILLVANWDKLAETGMDEQLYELFQETFPEYNIMKESSTDDIEDLILNGSVDCAFVFPGDSISVYQYYVNDISLYDSKTDEVDEALNQMLIEQKFIEEGVDVNKVRMYLNLSVSHDTISLGQDQSMNFLYTYIMIMALYMVIAMYGQMVATRVAAEKDSRAMELLIASAKPTALMFGKVVASALAGLFQITAIFGSFILFYHISGQANSQSILSYIFDIPSSLLGYMLVFFLLGYLLYAFLFGAIGSTVSKTEDLSSAITPVTLLFSLSFMIVIFSMSSGTVNSSIMKFCSYFPFTSPMAMFTRIAMSSVPSSSITICIAILVVSVLLIGKLSAKIYKAGVLMYGQKLNFIQLIKQIILAK